MQHENAGSDTEARYLVIGASGLIGQAFLRSAGTQAIGTFQSRPYPGGLRFDLAGDSIDDILDQLEHKVTHAFLLGGVTSIDACASDPRGTAAINVDGVIKAIDRLMARGVMPIFASTDGVYDGSHGSWQEEDPARPVLSYGRQKRTVEDHLQRCGSPWLALRISKVLDAGLSSQGVIGPWFDALAQGQLIRCATDQRFSPVAVEDVVAAVQQLVKKGAAGIYNIGGAEAVSRMELLEAATRGLEKHMTLRPNIERCSIRDFQFAEARPLDTSLSIQKLRAATDYQPEPLASICARAATAYARVDRPQRQPKPLSRQARPVQQNGYRGSVLVTGAGSLLGQPVATDLAASGFRVIGVFRSDNEWVGRLSRAPGVTLIRRDLTDPASLRDFRLDDCEAVVHLAATSPGPGHNLSDMLRDNIEATANVVRLAVGRGARRFLLASSMSVYGQPNVPVVDHRTPIIEPSPYGATKWISEQLLVEVSKQLPGIALRLPAILGKGARRHWLAGVLAHADAGADIAIYNPSAQHNNAVDALHLAGFINSLVSQEWSGFFALPLAARDPMTIEAVVDKIVSGMRSRSRMVIEQPLTRSFTIDYSLAASKFGYAPPTMADMLDRFVKAYR